MTLTPKSEALWDDIIGPTRALRLDIRDRLVAIEAAAARHARETGCEGLADEARLVAQWADAVDPMPDELRAELHDLGRHIAALAATEPVAPDDGRYASTIPQRSYSERTGRGAAAPEATCATCGHEKHQHPVDGCWEGGPMTTLYKVLQTGRRSNHDGSEWPEPPGVRGVDGEVVPCENGLHLVDAEHIIDWLHLGTEIWEAEPADGATVVKGPDKVAASAARLVRRLPWDDRAARLFGADCAEHVLHHYEDRYPDDDRPRKAIEVAREVADGRARSAVEAAAARSAAESAAEAAEAWSAAGSAARSAAWSAVEAVEAAMWSARLAAWSAAEREWQVRLLLRTLGIDR